MADPLWINAAAGAPAYTAAELRQAMALPLMYGGRAMGARQGVRPGGTQLQVTLVGSTITVATGIACVDPALSTPQGPYWVALNAAENHTLTAAHATNPRKDIVVLRIYDHDEDSSGLRTGITEYIAGTPAGAPAEPAVPAGAIRLATIDVPQSGGGAAVVTDRRPWTVATGGLLPVRDQSERDALNAAAHQGLAAYRLDRDWLEVWSGSAWITQGGLLVQVFTASGTWNRPPGLKWAFVEVKGGSGAGGGSGATAASQSSAGSGGGAGSHSWAYIPRSALGSSVTVTVGTGGAGAAGANGGNGTASSFGSLVTTNGGFGGQSSGASSAANVREGGDGGAAGTIDAGAGAIGVAVPGNAGDASSTSGSAGFGGGGGGPHGGRGRASAAGSATSLTGGAGGIGSGGGGAFSSNAGAAAAAGGAAGGGLVVVVSYL